MVPSMLLCLTGCGQDMREAPATVAQHPPAFHLSLPAFGGELLGSDYGEFGGELAFRSHVGTVTPLVAKNVVGLYAMPFGPIAITGPAHLGINEGEILVVSRRGEQRLRVERLGTLPSAPMEARRHENGGIELRLFTGAFSMNRRPMHTCWLLGVDKRLHPSSCPPDWPVDKGWALDTDTMPPKPPT